MAFKNKYAVVILILAPLLFSCAPDTPHIEATRSAEEAVTLKTISKLYGVREDWSAIRSVIFCKIFVVGRSMHDVETDLVGLRLVRDDYRDGLVRYRFSDAAIMINVADNFVVTYDSPNLTGEIVKVEAAQVLGRGTQGPTDGGYYSIKYRCAPNGEVDLTQ